jgi:hypothetical protein
VAVVRADDLLMGGVALLLVPLIAWRIYRGLRTGRLPLYRTTIGRDAGGGRFGVLLVLHLLSLLLIGAVAADLLLGLGLRERL